MSSLVSTLHTTLDANVINIAKKQLFMQMSSLDSTLDENVITSFNT
jgi:hypothetical protein